MTLRVGFTVFSYLLAGIGLGCLYLGEIYPLPLAVLLLSGLALCMVLEIRKVLPLSPLSHVQVPKWTLLALPMIFVLFDIPLLDFVSGFLTFILITRFIFKSELNDYLFGYLLSIACLLIGAIYVRDIIFGVMFLGFFLVLCWSLILYNMMVERAGSHSPPEVFLNVGERESSWTALIGLSSGLVVVSLLFTVLILGSGDRDILARHRARSLQRPSLVEPRQDRLELPQPPRRRHPRILLAAAVRSRAPGSVHGVVRHQSRVHARPAIPRRRHLHSDPDG